MSHTTSTRVRRAGGLTALTLGAFALGAPATALAAGDDPVDPGAATTPEGETATGEVLTVSPLAGTEEEDTDEDTTEVGAHFGWGKLDVDVVVAPGSSFPAGAVLDRTGATIRVTYSQIFINDVTDLELFPNGPPVLECTWDESDADGNGNLCDFTGPDGFVTEDGEAILLPVSAFTIELSAPPTSGQVLLPSGAARVIPGWTDWDDTSDHAVVFEAPGAYRTIGVTLTDARGTGVAGATFDLCTVAGGTCAAPDPSLASAGLASAGLPVVSATSTAAGRLLFPGLYLPGVYQIRQTASADGSPFSTAPLSLTLAAAGSAADTTAPVLLPVQLPTGATTPAAAPSSTATSTPSTAPGAVTTAGPPVAAAPSATRSRSAAKLADTGAEPLPIALLGAGLVLAGGAVTLAAARRRTR